MKTYWDHTEIERMKMTKEEVKSYIDIELMTKGVAKVTPPNLQEIKDVSGFEKVSFYSCAGILFKTIEQANAFIQLKPMKEDYDFYGAGYEYKYAKPIESAISTVSLFRESEIKENALTFKSNKTAKEFNEAEKKRYENEVAAMEAAVNPVWDDWHQKQSIKYKYETINRTYQEYLAMTKNDESLAKAFLTKIYTSSEVELAQDFIKADELQEIN